jgi:hypothetical protein
MRRLSDPGIGQMLNRPLPLLPQGAHPQADVGEELVRLSASH